MKVLLNISTLNKGGALQASVAFVKEVLKNSEGIEWCFAVSSVISKELELYSLNFDGHRVEVFELTPARSIHARRRLRALEFEFGPDIVFTFFGPAYVNFKAPHLCGVADGWVSHSNYLAFKGLGLSRHLLELPLRILHKAYWYRKADAWVVEAECAKAGLNNRFRFPLDKIFVVPNNCGQNYLEGAGLKTDSVKRDKVRILCLSAYYPQKNLEIIPFVAREIIQRQPGLSFEFVITLPENSAGLKKIRASAEVSGVSQYIHNIGPVALIDGPKLYDSCHISFLPSLLETFSANYPEAMAKGLPIVTTDLDFARSICGNAALYYRPMDPAAAATALLEIINDRGLWVRMLQEGKSVLAKLPLPSEKYRMYIDCLRKLLSCTAKKQLTADQETT